MINLVARRWIRWLVVQFIAIFCVVSAAVLCICGLTREAFGSSTSPYAPHMLLLSALFYGLHWRFQGWAYRIDPLRSDRLVALIKARNFRLDPEW